MTTGSAASSGWRWTTLILNACARIFEAKREPTVTELKVVDTYWSDHCRHDILN